MHFNKSHWEAAATASKTLEVVCKLDFPYLMLISCNVPVISSRFMDVAQVSLCSLVCLVATSLFIKVCTVTHLWVAFLWRMRAGLPSFLRSVSGAERGPCRPETGSWIRHQTKGEPQVIKVWMTSAEARKRISAFWSAQSFRKTLSPPSFGQEIFSSHGKHN